MKKILHARAFLFDFDGTLVDTMGGYADIAAELISEKVPAISFDTARRLYLETSGIPFFQQLEIILPGNALNREIAPLFEEKKQAGLFASRFSDEARYAVTRLREEGILAGISSNNQQELVDRFVDADDLVFDLVMGFAPGFEKGQPHFDKFEKEFNLAKADLVFVGDSLKDAEKALNGGLRFIALAGTFTPAEFAEKDKSIHVIESLKEITGLCGLS